MQKKARVMRGLVNRNAILEDLQQPPQNHGQAEPGGYNPFHACNRSKFAKDRVQFQRRDDDQRHDERRGFPANAAVR